MTTNLVSSALVRAAAGIDRAFIAAVQLKNRRRPSRGERLDHAGRMAALAAIAEAYRDPPPFAAPDPIEPRLAPVRAGVFDASWPSRFEPVHAAVRERYLGFADNRTAHARLFLGDGPRPAIILIHGYLAGHYRLEERVWPIAWMRRKGLDVALAVLPFHALRGDGSTPRFPGADPRFTNEGFRQAVYDLRSLVAWLRARGAPSVGVMGMSLGGYTTALLATVEPSLAFAVPMIPLASIADFALEQGRLKGSAAEVAEQHAALDRASQSVSPLARPPLLPRDRVLVVGAAVDRITPIAHAQRLARHFDAELLTIPGGHLVQIGRSDAFRAVARKLGALGLLSPAR